MKVTKVLVIDDDSVAFAPFRAAIKTIPNTELITAQTCEEGWKFFSNDPFGFSIAFVDYQYKHSEEGEVAEGHLTAKNIRLKNPCLPVYVVSGNYSTGALNDWQKEKLKFLYKPVTAEQVKALILHAIESTAPETSEGTEAENMNLWLTDTKLRKIQMDFGIAGVSDNIKTAIKKALICASVEESVFIDGETGTGKELIAKAIHTSSKRSRGPFVAINCAAIPEALFESEIFGHIRGAFTGATSDQLGAARTAHGGTLFLDEIHHLPKSQQAKLLRFTQDKTVKPVGHSREFKVDTRIICAGRTTNDCLLPDLFNRVAALEIDLAPLRERQEDIIPITKFIKRGIEKSLGFKKEFHKSCLELLRKYSWRGNARELHRVLKNMYLTVDSEIVLPKHLPVSVQKTDVFPYIDDESMNWNVTAA
ncbi:MAG: sigma-54-dependent Fis family transcriptional regulator [Bdellovibrionaceae bacterium]|nr:sigma-54-dependent Fis family transcriptional regulator [Pseudobdellovibrionaceae bacterium]